MKKIILGSDIDEVIFDMVPSFLSRLDEKYGIHSSIEDIVGQDIAKSLSVEEDKVYDAIMSVIGEGNYSLLTSSIIMPFIVEDHAVKNKIFLISSREPRFLKITKKELDKNFIDLNYELIFTNAGSKVDAVNKYNIDAFVEDDAETALDLLDKTNCFIFLFDKPWNRYIGEVDRLLRVRGWYDVGRIMSSGK